MGSPVDKEVQDALDRLELDIARLATNGTIVCEWCNASDVTDDAHRSGCPVPEIEGRLATVRRSLERLRRHPDAWSQEAFDQQKARAEAAEAEAQRYREGLREIERGGVGGVRAFARALLADSPDGANTEGGEA